jgi:hypothetical protein
MKKKAPLPGAFFIAQKRISQLRTISTPAGRFIPAQERPICGKNCGSLSTVLLRNSHFFSCHHSRASGTRPKSLFINTDCDLGLSNEAAL